MHLTEFEETKAHFLDKVCALLGHVCGFKENSSKLSARFRWSWGAEQLGAFALCGFGALSVFMIQACGCFVPLLRRVDFVLQGAVCCR